MILIHNKDFESLVKETDMELSKIGFDVSAGSIAKLFADIINKNLSEFYKTLTNEHIQAFVTTASNEFLDKIGKLVNCERILLETDDSYRARITNQVVSLSKANETAIRLAVLSVKGVEDVVLKKYSHGPGSFTIVPITKDITVPLNAEVESNVIEVASFGEKVIIKPPSLKNVKFNISLVFSLYSDDTKKQAITIAAREAIIEYINSIKIGDPLIINELTQRIMQIDESIINYSCNDFKINNKNCLFINQGARWDEKFVISPDSNAIIVA